MSDDVKAGAKTPGVPSTANPLPCSWAQLTYIYIYICATVPPSTNLPDDTVSTIKKIVG